MSLRNYRLAGKNRPREGRECRFAQTIITRGCGSSEQRPIENGSQGTQEFEKGFLLRCLELFKLCGDLLSLAGVPQDGLEQRDRSTIMHQTRMQADAPKRRSA